MKPPTNGGEVCFNVMTIHPGNTAGDVSLTQASDEVFLVTNI